MINLKLEVEAIQKDSVKLLRLLILYCGHLTIPTNENLIIGDFKCTEEAIKFTNDISDYFIIKKLEMTSHVTEEIEEDNIEEITNDIK